MTDKISIRGAKVHNLKSVSTEIPKKKFVLITGVSGSGKSSLAFDTIYAEGQRRYVESLSSYARQFLGIMDKPDVESIEGLSPAISIEQRSISSNPRSTISTTTEIYDYLRVLFARTGDIFCYKCGKPVKRMSIDEIVDDLMQLPEGTSISVLAPVIRSQKGEHKELLKKIMKKGFTRVYVDSEPVRLSDSVSIDRNKAHTVEIVIDRIKMREGVRPRITQSVELALKETEGTVAVIIDEKEKKFYNEVFACPDCMISYGEITPRTFSFNSPYGACPECHGLGTVMEIDPDSVIANGKLSILEGAISPWGDAMRRYDLQKLAKKVGFDLRKPYDTLPDDVKRMILKGLDDKDIRKYGIDFEFEAVLPHLKRLYLYSDSQWMLSEINKYTVFKPCSACSGSRLNQTALSVRINGLNINDIVRKNINEAYDWFVKLKLSKEKGIIAKELIEDITKKLHFLTDVGVGYLTLDRATESLSGGEAQRVKLATQIGSGLTDVVYVLDEPSIGLHQRDNEKLIATLKHLRDIGNSVLVVEHDRQFIEESDHILDLGPFAGEHGGEIVYQGDISGMMKSSKSLTGKFMSGRDRIFEERNERKPAEGYEIIIKGASEHNLKDIDVRIPLGMFVCVTGVSGSGKSTLVNDVLYNALKREFGITRKSPGAHKAIENVHLIDKVIDIDQTPIGRTPRSNPATYTGVFTPIRELFAEMKESKLRGYKPGRFSFNVKGGRCEACEGDGLKRIEMHFLPDVYIQCEVCKGKRFNQETLHAKYRGKNISDVLDMSVSEAIKHFEEIGRISSRLRILEEVGLGYVKLGQPAPSLSGGEAQRVKLAKELTKTDTGRTLYILDEPTTGLHFYDVKLLLKVLDRLVKKGNTLLIIEHNMDVIKYADWIIDLGPEGGDEGGRLICQGSVEDVMNCPQSFTGAFLKKDLSVRKGTI